MYAHLMVAMLFAAPAPAPVEREIVLEACHVPYTDFGSRATWAENAIFTVETDSSGKPGPLQPLSVRIAERALDLAAFRDCLGRWRLLPTKHYTLVFYAGTTGPALKELAHHGDVRWRIDPKSATSALAT